MGGLGFRAKDLLVGALLLRVEDAEAGDGGEEDDGAAGAGGDHAAGAGLGDEEGAGEVDVEEGAEGGGVVGFGFDVGTGLGLVGLVWFSRVRGKRFLQTWVEIDIKFDTWG